MMAGGGCVLKLKVFLKDDLSNGWRLCPGAESVLNEKIC